MTHVEPWLDIQKEFFRVDIPLVVTLIIFALIMSLISFKLYQQFGWNIYKKIGADIKMQKLYKTMLLFVMLLKLDLFFLLLVSIEKSLLLSFRCNNYDIFLGSSRISIFTKRMENRNENLHNTINGYYYRLYNDLRSATSTVSNSWYFFIVFLSVSIILCTATWVYAILVYRNFGKRLKNSS
ncbi:unnamed protein product [Rhizophagus irregularis]|nr:unnamed protein product [Rhizophagus irregularis]